MKYPDFDVAASRRAGVLMHLTSLHSADGIGNAGAAARGFARWMSSCGLGIWQILPLMPTDEGGCPYASWSAFAGNPLLVDTEDLADAGLLERSELPRTNVRTGRVDFESVKNQKLPLLERAAQRLFADDDHGLLTRFEAYCEAEASWLDDAALFWALRGRFGDLPWWSWPPEIAQRDDGALRSVERELSEEVAAFRAIQFFFDEQMERLRTLCGSLDLLLLGDIPLYVSANSCDVWSHPDLFQLDAQRRPLAEGGVPPDYFSVTGQRWGNPLYAWSRHRNDDFDWWTSRCRRALRHCHALRLDHFRGFSAYWSIPTGAADAREGRWEPGPGRALFQALHTQLGALPFIAEDLGDIDDDVHRLRDEFKLAGMRVLQFGFGGDGSNIHLPHHHPRRAVVYTGTHDNDTARGWWENADENTRLHFSSYTGRQEDERRMAKELVRLAFSSPAAWCVIPMQDLIGLDAESKMNRPGTLGPQNWSWQMGSGPPGDHVSRSIRQLCRLYDRAHSGASSLSSPPPID